MKEMKKEKSRETKIAELFFKTIFICFNLFMLILFIRGYFFPVQSNFWLANYAFNIITIEGFTIFGVLLICNIKVKDKNMAWNIFVLIMIVLILLIYFVKMHNYKLFLFFALTLLSKFIFINKSNNKEQTMNYAGLLFILFLIGIVAVIFSFIGGWLMPQHQILLERMIANGTMEIDVLNSPSFIFAFGALYYIGISLLEMTGKKRKKKDGRT